MADGELKYGWWEEYPCGCVSPIVRRKRDLVGYCPVHGGTRLRVWREDPRQAEFRNNDTDPGRSDGDIPPVGGRTG